MEAKGGGDDNFGQVFSGLNTDRQKEVLETAKTLLKVQRTSKVLIDNEEDIKAFSVKEKQLD
ncbi:hypothetical protein AGMMS49942_21860 [Spirochaetia bacterium]|nr:hypothetical protein AGMMS49942_21860 [Spirochaetia bacterium]